MSILFGVIIALISAVLGALIYRALFGEHVTETHEREQAELPPEEEDFL